MQQVFSSDAQFGLPTGHALASERGYQQAAEKARQITHVFNELCVARAQWMKQKIEADPYDPVVAKERAVEKMLGWAYPRIMADAMANSAPAGAAAGAAASSSSSNR